MGGSNKARQYIDEKQGEVGSLESFQGITVKIKFYGKIKWCENKIGFGHEDAFVS